MITETSFRSLLQTLNFLRSGEIYEKKFPQYGTSMRVDFSIKKLFYPDAIKGRERNDSFDAPENFVVFECVNRLLDKGYRPEHIELEKEWHLGHAAKSGRADVCVTDANGSMLFIIECKTWGREFDKALADTKTDGAQLFSYWQQEQSCKWLILYASELKGHQVEYKAPTIDCSDDANIELLAKKDKSIKLYRQAHTAPEKYEVWKDTYGSQVHEDLVFYDDSVAYKIGVKPLRKKDLRDFTPDDKIVNRFEEILRHNNVSDKENAFNRLISYSETKIFDKYFDQLFHKDYEPQKVQALHDLFQALEEKWNKDNPMGLNEALLAMKAYAPYHHLYAISVILCEINKMPESVPDPATVYALLSSNDLLDTVIDMAGNCLNAAFESAL